MANYAHFSANDLEAWFFQDRAAVLASCQVPFIVALAGKNNIISSKQFLLSMWRAAIDDERLQ